jgi:hypothetical protein
MLAHGNYRIEMLPGELADVLAAMAIRANAKLLQDAPGKWVDALGVSAGAIDFIALAGLVPPWCPGELAAARIADAQDQDALLS